MFADASAVSDAPQVSVAPSDPLRLMRGLVHGLGAEVPRPRIRTGLSAIDTLLAGGLPCGAVTEIVGRTSSGRTSLAYAVMATVTAAGELAAWIDLPDAFDPEHADAAGVRLPRLLWIRPPDARAAFCAAEHVLSAGGFRVVLLDLDAPQCARWTAPAAVWLRLVRAAAREGAAIVTTGTQRAAVTFAVLCLEVGRRQAAFIRRSGPSPLFAGIASAIHVRKNKLGPPDPTPARFFAAAAA